MKTFTSDRLLYVYKTRSQNCTGMLVCIVYNMSVLTYYIITGKF